MTGKPILKKDLMKKQDFDDGKISGRDIEVIEED